MSANLHARYWRFSRRVDWLVDTFSASLDMTPECSVSHTLAREAAALQLQDQWSNFCRDIITASWRGGVATAGGTYIPRRAGRTSEAAAVSFLRSTYTGRLRKSNRWKPKWFDPVEALDAAKRLQIANLANVAAGIGATPSPLPELRAVRNYFAHKEQIAVTAVAPFIGVNVTTSTVHSHVLMLATTGGATRFEHWSAQIRYMAHAAVQ